MIDRRQWINLGGAAVCASMFAFAIYSEKVLGLVPCPLCMFQRVCIVALGIVFLVAGLHRVGPVGGRIYSVWIFLAAGAACWVAGRHVWIQAQPPGTVPSCGAPLDNLLQMFPLAEVIRRVMTGGGECGLVDWSFLGLSMPAWVLIMAAILGIGGIANNLFNAPRRA